MIIENASSSALVLHRGRREAGRAAHRRRCCGRRALLHLACRVRRSNGVLLRDGRSRRGGCGPSCLCCQHIFAKYSITQQQVLKILPDWPAGCNIFFMYQSTGENSFPLAVLRTTGRGDRLSAGESLPACLPVARIGAGLVGPHFPADSGQGRWPSHGQTSLPTTGAPLARSDTPSCCGPRHRKAVDGGAQMAECPQNVRAHGHCQGERGPARAVRRRPG